jgi:hypothetical protein
VCEYATALRYAKKKERRKPEEESGEGERETKNESKIGKKK